MNPPAVAHTFETSDLYEAAYLGYNEFPLVELHVNDATVERHVVFTFGGEREAIRGTARAYFSGQALVNLKEYRFHLEKMKDRMFKALRKGRGQRSRSRAVSSATPELS